MRFRHSVRSLSVLTFVAGLAGSPIAMGQLETGFEPPDYTAGVPVAGQNGWYIPPVGGVDQIVYSSSDNALGFPANPEGGEQFIGGVTANNTPARAQHDVDFSVADKWDICYDIAVTFTGQLPAAINLASFSLQDSTQARFFISLNNFMDTTNPDAGWKAEYNVYNANGNNMDNQSPGAAWTNLAVNHWYRLCAHVNFATNQVTHVEITDLETGDKHEADVDWYLTGGANPVLPLPTAVRAFVGGNNGNTAGYDNVSVKVAGGDECYPDFTGDGVLDLFDFLGFVNSFNAGEDRANCDQEGGLDLFDFLCFTNAFNAGC